MGVDLGGAERKIGGEYDQNIWTSQSCHKIHLESRFSSAKPSVPTQRSFEIKVGSNPNTNVCALSDVAQVTLSFLNSALLNLMWDAPTASSSFWDESRKYLLPCLCTAATQKH